MVRELKVWLNEDPERASLMVKEAPIGESTLRATISGRYNPGPLLERAIRAVMLEHPVAQHEKTAVG